MSCRGVICIALVLGGVSGLQAQTAKKLDPKQPPPAVVEILKSTPEEFLKKHDKNKDGYLSKDELPPFLAQQFEKCDVNGDGKLDRQELTQVFQRVRARFGSAAPTTAAGPEVEKIIAKIMLMDANKDGKISRDEAKGKIAENFEKLDLNGDGFLDRDEVRKIAQNVAKGQKGANPPAQAAGGPAAIPDFDALDQNADGRLTREELQGTPYAGQFDQIDANHDGRLDRREFESFFRKKGEKQK